MKKLHEQYFSLKKKINDMSIPEYDANILKKIA